jgi:hypothetical protein
MASIKIFLVYFSSDNSDSELMVPPFSHFNTVRMFNDGKPTPRKLNAASIITAKAKMMLAITITEEIVLGPFCLSSILNSDCPMARATSTVVHSALHGAYLV